MKPLQIFIGIDPRQPVSVSTLINSIYRQSSVPVSITPIVLSQVPLERRGLTEFTYSRFLTPYLSNYEGWSLFLDADILLRADIAELFALADDRYTVMVSKNEHKFEWASVMLFNNAKCGILTPEYIEKAEGLHGIGFANPDEIGDLPREWNHLVGYDEPRSDAKLVHYTQGIPYWPETRDCEYSKEWWHEFDELERAQSWETIMGPSIHAVNCNGLRMLPKFLFDLQKGEVKVEYQDKVRELLNDQHSPNIKKPD